MDDPSGYLPPHELRGIAGNLVDRDDGRMPGPSIATASSPGISPAAASPTGVAPTLPSDDPASIAIAIARIAGESFGGASVLPIPAPERAASEVGLPSGISPGISPQLAAAGPSSTVPTDPVAPQLQAAPPPAGAGVPSQTTTVPSATTPPSAPSMNPPTTANPLDALRDFGGVVRVPFAPSGDVAGIPSMDVASAMVPPLGGVGAMTSPPSPSPSPPTPPSPASQEPPTFGFLGFPVEYVPLVGDVQPTSSTQPTADRVPLDGDYEPATPQVHGGDPARARSTGGTAFDPYAVRRDFPILEERVHGGKRLVWLDNAATTQKPRSVIDRLTYFYEHENSNVHRAAHTLAARATDAFESARETTRKFLGAPSTSEIVFVRGATEGINLIAKSWGKRNIERGDEIVLTHLEHHANIVPWQQLCAETGARLRIAPVDDRGDVILDEYEKLMCSRTKLVAFTQVSNALGTVTPAREMIEIAHRWGATVLLDGAQAVSHMAVDVQALDCDFYVFSGHKVFAPTGIGAVFGKRALLDAMPPWQGGGNMIADVTFEKTVYQPPPWRFEAGTGNIADAAGLGAALDYVMRIGMPTIERYEHELLVYATERLATVPGLRMIGTAREKAGVLSFVLAGQRTEDVGAALDKEGIAVRSGHHCAQPILRRFGLEASVRASLAFYNVPEDIDALVAALKRLQASV